MALAFVRPARPDDAAEIGRIQLATWRHAYHRLLPRSVLEGVDQAWLAHRWRTSIEAPPSPRHRVLVAVEQAELAYLVGFAASGEIDETALAPDENPSDLIRPDIASVTDLLVEPRWSRRGHGSRLLASCVDHWRGDGFTTALAWAFAADTGYQRFLGSAGWQLDGAARALEMDGELVDQVRLHAAL
ncbi:MAG TPA: GNAT family N-acetyltransferase [Micromonosporaceae bacterium]|jgi:GNAT superfamily N-acetyltransferase